MTFWNPGVASPEMEAVEERMGSLSRLVMIAVHGGQEGGGHCPRHRYVSQYCFWSDGMQDHVLFHKLVKPCRTENVLVMQSHVSCFYFFKLWLFSETRTQLTDNHSNPGFT